MDEVHFQQYGSRCRIWVPPEVKDPVLPHHPTRKSVGYFGAVRLRDGKFIFARELNRFDAVSTWNFLRLLRRRSLNSRRRVIVITDNAKYHHAKLHSAWRQEHQAHFRLDYLPPYSPELNPIERVWKLTRIDYSVTSSRSDHNVRYEFCSQINHRDFDSFSAGPVQSESQIMFPVPMSEIAIAGPYPELGPLLPRVPSDRAVGTLVSRVGF